MKIIALEGLDKAGKFTQASLLFDYLSYEGYKVHKTEFHRYDTIFGQIIRQWLDKTIILSQETVELVIAADKQNIQDSFNQLERLGYDYIIIDRYINSQIAYSLANGVDKEWALNLIKYMRNPSIEILIDIDEKESYKRKGKFGVNDRYEEDMEFLKKVRRAYLDIFNKDIKTCDSNKIIISGYLDIIDIHSEIIKNINLLENL